jgi:hypothetical protein
MRRRGARLVTGAAALLLAACGAPSGGVDGDLAGGWDSFGMPVAFTPAAQVCHQEPYLPTVPAPDYRPVSCDRPHLSETVYVGTFSGKTTERKKPPELGSVALRRAYRECEQRAGEYLGANFRHGRLWLGVATPSAAGWRGGARWFRCDLLEVASLLGEPVERDAPLAGALAKGSGGLGLKCFRTKTNDGDIEEMSPIGCKKVHQVEFVGVWRAPDGPYPGYEDDSAEATVYDGCREKIAEYVDVPVDGDLTFRTGAIALWMSKQDWRMGDRAFRCLLWLPGRDIKKSLAGAGTDALPVRTE